jgi:hypothetical protein
MRSPGTIVAPSRTVIVVPGPIIIVRRTVIDLRRPVIGRPTAVNWFALTVGAEGWSVLAGVPYPTTDLKAGRNRIAVLVLVFNRTPAVGAVSHLHRAASGNDGHNWRLDPSRLAQIKRLLCRCRSETARPPVTTPCSVIMKASASSRSIFISYARASGVSGSLEGMRPLSILPRRVLITARNFSSSSLESSSVGIC